MKALRTLVLCLTIVGGVAPSAAAQTTLVVHHNANLRADHSTQSAITDHLEPGDEVMTVAPDKTSGFWLCIALSARKPLAHSPMI